MKIGFLLATIAATAIYISSAQDAGTSPAIFSKHLAEMLDGEQGLKAATIAARELRIATESDPGRARLYTRIVIKTFRYDLKITPRLWLRATELMLEAAMNGYLSSRGKPDSRLVPVIMDIYKSLPPSVKAAVATSPRLYAVLKAVDLKHGGDSAERQALFERLFGELRGPHYVSGSGGEI